MPSERSLAGYRAYDTTLEVEGGGTVQLKRRERPQLLLRNGTPAVLYTAVMQDPETATGPTFTWAQALGVSTPATQLVVHASLAGACGSLLVVDTLFVLTG